MNRQLELGIAICMTLAPRGIVGGDEIANEVGCSVIFAQQILLKLKRKGIVESKQGRDGGYYLIKSTNVLEIAQAMGVDVMKPLKTEKSALQFVFSDIESKVTKQLEGTKIIPSLSQL